MRYRDKPEADPAFSSPSDVGQSLEVKGILGDIHKLPDRLFLTLYAERAYLTHSPHLLQLLHEITGLNARRWKELLDAESTGGLRRLSDAELEEVRDWFIKDHVTLLVAPIATGKTTFLHYLLRFFLPARYKAVFGREIVPILIDCREEFDKHRGAISPAASDDDPEPVSLASVMRTFIFEEIERKIDAAFDCFDRSTDHAFFTTYHRSEVAAFADWLRDEGVATEAGVYPSQLYSEQRSLLVRRKRARPAEAVNKKLEYVRRRYPQADIAVALDNTDHIIELDPNVGVVIANHVLGVVSAPVILTLRDTSFRQTQSAATERAWPAPEPVYLATLPAKSLGEKRLKALVERRSTTACGTEDVFAFLRKVLQQLQRPQYRSQEVAFDLQSIWFWLESFSNGDIREMLRLLRIIIASNNLTASEFRKHTGEGLSYDPRYRINVKRFKTAFINGWLPYFDENAAETNVVNLFEANLNTGYRHILPLKLLQYISARRIFVMKEVVDVIERKYNKNVAEAARGVLQRFVNKGLITVEMASGSGVHSLLGRYLNLKDPAIQEAQAYVSQNGHFHLDTLVYDDIYLDEMKFCTDLSDKEYATVFSGKSQKVPFQRILATKFFVRVLQDEELLHKGLSENLGVKLILENVHEYYVEAKMGEGYHWIGRYR